METEQKNSVLSTLARLLELNKEQIKEANKADLHAFPDMDDSMRDRLRVDDKKIDGMIRSVEEVAALPDPEGKILYDFTREDGLHVTNRTVPFGTILIIYESRPDVTIEAAATAFKAGNRILLKGGKEARNTNLLLTGLWQQALTREWVQASGELSQQTSGEHCQQTLGELRIQHPNTFFQQVPALQKTNADYIQYLDLSREETQRLIKENSHRVDLIIPRGGEGLIRFVQENSSVPVIVSGRGNNFLYVDDDSVFEMATRLIINGKKRISVCNAIDKVLLHKNLDGLQEKLSDLVSILTQKGIEVWGNKDITALNDKIKEENDAATLCEEYLAPKLYLSLVDGMTEAIGMINRYSGGHTAVIVTRDSAKADQFMQQVDCAAVYHNASSRFTDGGQFGVGAEIAISTQKLHFRGPLGAQELVTNKWFVYGEGQIRE